MAENIFNTGSSLFNICIIEILWKINNQFIWIPTFIYFTHRIQKPISKLQILNFTKLLRITKLIYKSWLQKVYQNSCFCAEKPKPVPSSSDQTSKLRILFHEKWEILLDFCGILRKHKLWFRTIYTRIIKGFALILLENNSRQIL